MLSFSNLNKDQAKEIARFLLDIAKASIIGSIALNSLSNANIFQKIFYIIGNFVISYICINKALTLLKK